MTSFDSSRENINNKYQVIFKQMRQIFALSIIKLTYQINFCDNLLLVKKLILIDKCVNFATKQHLNMV